MSNNAGKNILNLIVEENLASAQQMIKDRLSGKLSSALDSKFEEFASTIFESKKSKKAKKDWDGDGEVECPECKGDGGGLCEECTGLINKL